MDELATRLDNSHSHLKDDTFSVIVAGRFKNGKSTLLNALLGKPTHPVPGLPAQQGPMKSDDLPCTATLTRVVYADKPFVTKWAVDGTSEEWSLTRYLDDAIVKDSEEETERFFDQIREFEVGFPSELCQSGVIMLDSPGTSDMPKRTAYTAEAVKRSDAAIVVFSDKALAGQDEREFVQKEIIGSGTTRVFTVVNTYNPVTERTKRFTWNRIVTNKSETYTEDDLERNDIFFVNAKVAFESKLVDDHAGMECSGLLKLESRLGNFLAYDRHFTHIERFVRQAMGLGGDLNSQISQRLSTLGMDRQRIQSVVTEIEAKLQSIRARRTKLESIFKRYNRLVQSEACMSFEAMLRRSGRTLEEKLKNRKLKSLDGLGNTLGATFNSKPAKRETVKLAEEILCGDIKDWSSSIDDPEGLQQTIMPHISDMLREIEAEVAAIDADIRQIHFEAAGGVGVDPSNVTVVSVKERVLTGIAGLFVGDFSSIIGASGGGWASVAGNVAGQLSAFGVLYGLAALGVAVGPIAIPVILATGLVGGFAGAAAVVENRIKSAVAAKVKEALETNTQAHSEKMGAELDLELKKMETVILDEVSSVIKGEEEKLCSMRRDSVRDEQDKAHLQVQLEETNRKAGSLITELSESLSKAKQA